MNTKNNTIILVVEDDKSLSDWICDYLHINHFSTKAVYNGRDAVEFLRQEAADIVLLDIMLPIKDGFDVCKEARDFYQGPIIIMSANHSESDEVLGLELGADDYLAKPIKPRVLLARIKASLRRGDTKTDSKALHFGALTINSVDKIALINEQVIPLTYDEFELLWILASNAGNIVSRHALVKALRGIEYDGFDRSVDIKVHRLRKKLFTQSHTENATKDTTKEDTIKTVRGKGYLFSAKAW